MDGFQSTELVLPKQTMSKSLHSKDLTMGKIPSEMPAKANIILFSFE